MQQHKIKVVAVDDDELNLEVLNKNLEEFGYDVSCFDSGQSAWDYMSKNPEMVDLVLLDKMMPGMNGLEVLNLMKKDNILKDIPVIIQTGDVGTNEAKQGLVLGAYYYLTKPFDPEMMLALVNAAVRDLVIQNDAKKNNKIDINLAHLLIKGNFRIREVEEAKQLANILASNSFSPDKLVVAFSEILVNAIEHGNLQIGYETKKNLLSSGTWLEEVHRRLSLPENIDKFVNIDYELTDSEVVVKIEDCGYGFNYKEYLEFDPWRLTDPNGRGIATAKNMGLKLEYIEPGNRLICRCMRKIIDQE